MSNFHLPPGPPPPGPPGPPPPPVMNPAEQLRKSFTVSGTVARATAYVSGVGWVNAFINGEEVALATANCHLLHLHFGECCNQKREEAVCILTIGHG